MTCPVRPVISLNRPQGSSPLQISWMQDSDARPPSPSPTIKIRSTMNVPSIATTCSSPLASPMKFATFTSPASPTQQRGFNIPSNTGSASTVSSLSLSSNDREQPKASACPVMKQACPVVKIGVTTGAAKRKLGKGCSLLDWIRLCRTKKREIAGPGGEKMSVTLSELAKHNKEEDAWTAIKGKVYNLTHYIRFHPGGKDELMKGAGIDCSILFDEVHSWVNVENTLKACLVGPLLENSPTTQRRNSSSIVKKATKLRNDLTVPRPLMIIDGVNKQAVPAGIHKISMEQHLASQDSEQLTIESTASRKNSLDLRMDDNTGTRKNSMAAIACEEPDGLRQDSPESPVRPLVSDTPPKKSSTASLEASEGSSMRLSLPPSRIRRNSEPHPRFHWVQSEKAVIIHIATNNTGMKNSDVILDVNGRSFEAAMFVSGWVFELNIKLAHTVVASQVALNCGRVEISLKKETLHQQWEDIGEFLDGHSKITHKSKRDAKYHTSRVEGIRSITHDTKVYTLRLPGGSYLNVPTGHHLSIKATVCGEEVVRSYTPVSPLEQRSIAPPQEGEAIELMIKLYDNGKMSSFLSSLKEGDEVMVSDPEGTFDAQARLAPTSNILLIAAGSGFTPMVKILRDYVSTESVHRQRIISTSEASGEASEEEQTAPELPPTTNKICEEESKGVGSPRTAKLLFANKKERDVMCKEELAHLEAATAGRFSVAHILSNADRAWGGLRGRVSETLLRAHLPAVNIESLHDTLVCICGPEPFTASVCNTLMDLDFPDECVQVFQ